MNYPEIRDKIAAMLSTVEGIGRVYKSPRYATDWMTYLEQFKVRIDDRDVINACWLTRNAIQETDIARSEAGEIASVSRTENWLITLVYGFDDDESSPSEFAFQALLDGIQEKFRFADFLGMPEIVAKHFPIQVQSAGLYFFGDVLCHKAEMLLKLQQ